jgi:hypothetical protein
VLLRLLRTCQLEIRWIWAGVRCVLIRDGGWGTSGRGLRSLGQEAMVNVYGVVMAMPQG